MPTKKQDEKFAAHLPGLFRYHANMLSDGVRNDLVSRALKAVVRDRSAVLDVGAGSGIWAIRAAKLGAKRVVAVEIEEALISVILKHAQENGVGDRIEVIQGNIDDLRLREKFDVIVCELFGRDIFGEATINSLIRIRERFLAPQGSLIPQRLEMYAIPLSMPEKRPRFPDRLDLSTAFLQSLALNYPRDVSFIERSGFRYAGKAQPMFEIDLRTVSSPPAHRTYEAAWKLADVSKVNSIVLANRSDLGNGLVLDSLRSRSWNVTRYDFEPFAVNRGELRFAIDLDPRNQNWTVSLPSHPEIRPRSYSPVFGFTRTRMAQASMPPIKKVSASRSGKKASRSRS